VLAQPLFYIVMLEVLRSLLDIILSLTGVLLTLRLCYGNLQIKVDFVPGLTFQMLQTTLCLEVVLLRLLIDQVDMVQFQ